MEGAIPTANNCYGFYDIKLNDLFITLKKIVKYMSQNLLVSPAWDFSGMKDKNIHCKI